MEDNRITQKEPENIHTEPGRAVQPRELSHFHRISGPVEAPSAATGAAKTPTAASPLGQSAAPRPMVTGVGPGDDTSCWRAISLEADGVLQLYTEPKSQCVQGKGLGWF